MVASNTRAGGRGSTALVVTSVFGVALAVRAFSLYQSPLPFIVDGILYADHARLTIADGTFPIQQLATDELVFTSLIAVVSRATGIEPLSITQPLSIFLGALPILVAIALTFRLGARWEWSVERRAVAATVAGLLLALNGAYLQRSYAADEQTLGLFLVALLAIATVNAIHARDWRWGGLVVLILVVMPPLHNLSSLVAALVVTSVLFYAVLHQDAGPTTVLALLGLVCFAALVWGYSLGYHRFVEQFIGLRIVQSERLVRAPGVFLAWAVLIGVAVAWLPNASRWTKLALAGGTLGIGFVLLVVDALQPLYPATAGIPSLTVVLLLPLLIPAAVAGVALPRLENRTRPEMIVLALFVGPLTILGFAMTAGVTVDYHQTLHRGHLFVHLPLVVLAGCGVGWSLLDASSPKWRTVRGGLVCLLVLCAAVSAPVSFLGPETRIIAGTTTTAEFDGITFAEEHVAGDWATDGHLGRVATYFDGTEWAPVVAWAQGTRPAPACPVLASSTWTASGVQAAPAGPVPMSDTQMDAWTSTRNQVYTAQGSSTVTLVTGQKTSGSC